MLRTMCVMALMLGVLGCTETKVVYVPTNAGSGGVGGGGAGRGEAGSPPDAAVPDAANEVCGNTYCDLHETKVNCPQDCSCNDFVCAPFEYNAGSCPFDCGRCGEKPAQESGYINLWQPVSDVAATWNWAATAQSLGELYGQVWDQCELVSLEFDGTLSTCCGALVSTGFCDGSPDFGTVLTDYLGLSYDQDGLSLSEDDLYLELSNGRPFVQSFRRGNLTEYIVVYSYAYVPDHKSTFRGYSPRFGDIVLSIDDAFGFNRFSYNGEFWEWNGGFYQVTNVSPACSL